MPIKYVLRCLSRMLRAAQVQLETCISATATGDTRNKMTDANIHLGSCINTLDEICK
jgi:hypothetical protein